MRSILYWSSLILAAMLLARITPFSLTPIVFLVGALLFAAGYLVFRSYRRPHSGTQDPGAFQRRFVGSILIYVMIYWTTVGLFTNVKAQREFLARYEPYMQGGQQHGYTFYYVDYAGSYERINSPELNKLIAEKNPERVRMVLEVVKDFGKLRAYTVRSVESISVTMDWTDGSPPWEALRRP